MAIKITSGENKPQKTYNTSQPIPIQKNQMGCVYPSISSQFLVVQTSCLN